MAMTQNASFSFRLSESSSPYFFAFGDGYSSLREFIGFYVEWLK